MGHQYAGLCPSGDYLRDVLDAAFVNIFGFFYAWKTGVPFDQAMQILWDEDSAIIFSSVIAFWFGSQSFKK